MFDTEPQLFSIRTIELPHFDDIRKGESMFISNVQSILANLKEDLKQD